MHQKAFLAAVGLAAILLVSCGRTGEPPPAAPPPPPPPPPAGPAITIEPSDQTVQAGQAATFTATATGAAPLSYQWQKKASPIAGAPPATHTTGAPTAR